MEVTDAAEGDGGATDDEEALSGLATATGVLTELAADAARLKYGMGGALGWGGDSTAACKRRGASTMRAVHACPRQPHILLTGGRAHSFGQKSCAYLHA